jgi:hypothetical protein
MIENLLKLIDALGIPLALMVVAVGAVAWWLAKDLFPWLGRRIDSFCTWLRPYATRWLEAKLRDAARSAPVAREPPAPTAAQSAALLQAEIPSPAGRGLG